MGKEQGTSTALSVETAKPFGEKPSLEAVQRHAIPIYLNGEQAPSYVETYTHWQRRSENSVPLTVITKGMYNRERRLFEENPEQVAARVENIQERVLPQLLQDIPGSSKRELLLACKFFLKRHRSQADREAVRDLENLSEKYEPYVDQVLKLADYVTQQDRADLIPHATSQTQR